MVLYTLTGAFGYVACGSATQGDILLNFPSNDVFADVARALMAIHVTLAMPVIVVPCRRSILMLRLFIIEQWRQCRGQQIKWDGSSVGTAGAAGDASPPLLGPSDPHASTLAAYSAMESGTRVVCGVACSAQHFAWNLVLVVGGAIIAVALPQVAVVFGLLGATISTAQIYVFPALMLLVRANEVDATAAAQTSASLPGEIDSDSDQQHLLQGAATVTAQPKASGVDAAASKDDTLPYVPSSPFWLRIHAWGLICVALFIGLLGTGANIFSTWLEK